MTYMIYGAAGALLVLAILAGGALLGWRANAAYGKYRCTRAAEEATEEQRRQFAAQQQAFESMLNYNQDTAYGIAGDAGLLTGGDGV